jgi:hypothetical protein
MIHWRGLKLEIGAKRIYNTVFEERGIKNVILWDVFPIKDGETVLVYFESKNSDWAQGIWLMCDKRVEINSKRGKSASLWYDNTPIPVMVRCHTSNGLLNVYNIWNKGNGQCSQAYSSGMLVEELSNGRRYKCNDIGFETNFDKLVFRIELYD